MIQIADGAAFHQSGVEVMGDAVLLDHRAVGVGAAVQAGAIAIGWEVGAVNADHDAAVGELAGWAEHHDWFTFCRRVPYLVGSRALSDPWQPGRGQFAGFTFTRGGSICAPSR